jgi:hypothetical protein
MSTPTTILDLTFERVTSNLIEPIIKDSAISQNVEFVCRNPQNRAGVRLLLACLLAKVHRSNLDIRKPYTEIGGEDCYSGRTYDEAYVTAFINKHSLPCNPTTAFLTPALRISIPFPPINRTCTLSMHPALAIPNATKVILLVVFSIHENHVLD